MSETLTVKKVSILGTGAYVPPKILSNAELEKFVDTTDEWIKTRTGIEERRILSDPGMATSDMAFFAAKQALAMAKCEANDIDLIIVCTYSPDYMFPATACIVQHKLQAKRSAAFDLEIACSGFVYGLTTGSQFIASGMFKRVLVIGADVNSRITDWEDRNTCVIFGDGAAAVVLGPGTDGGEILSCLLGSDGSGAELLIQPAGGTRNPTTHETIDKRLHLIHMEGKETFKFAVKIMNDAAEEVLRRAGVDKSRLDLLIPHQANIRIIESSAKRLNLPMEKVLVNINKYGNTVGASVGLALDEAVRSERIKEGDHSVMVAFGAGLSWGASCVRWNRVPHD